MRLPSPAAVRYMPAQDVWFQSAADRARSVLTNTDVQNATAASPASSCSQFSRTTPKPDTQLPGHAASSGPPRIPAPSSACSKPRKSRELESSRNARCAADRATLFPRKPGSGCSCLLCPRPRPSTGRARGAGAAAAGRSAAGHRAAAGQRRHQRPPRRPARGGVIDRGSRRCWHRGCSHWQRPSHRRRRAGRDDLPRVVLGANHVTRGNLHSHPSVRDRGRTRRWVGGCNRLPWHRFISWRTSAGCSRSLSMSPPMTIVVSWGSGRQPSASRCRGSTTPSITVLRCRAGLLVARAAPRRGDGPHAYGHSHR